MSRPALLLLFFFQAEDGIRDHCVTGVQTCALPISIAILMLLINSVLPAKPEAVIGPVVSQVAHPGMIIGPGAGAGCSNAGNGGETGYRRSEERRVGKEGRWGWAWWTRIKVGE